MEKCIIAGFTLSRVVAVILLCTCGFPATLAQSQTGFLNIDCGATEKYVDPATGLNWVPDAPYITTGTIQSNLTLPTSLQSFTEMKSLRYFDYFRPNDPQMKYCYALPVIPNTVYLLRATFFYGNYDNSETPPSFQLAIDATIINNLTTSATDGEYAEFQYVSQGNVTFLCLIRTSPLSTPFISGITLKPASTLILGFNQKFSDYLQEGITMVTLARVNYGGLGMIRFPTDIYDRFWFAEGQNSRYYLIPTTSPVEFLSTPSTFADLVSEGFGPPSAVMQTAVTSSGTITSYLIPSDPNLGGSYSVYASVYYGELVNSGTPTLRQFSIGLGGSLANVNLSGTFLQYASWNFWPTANIEQDSTMTLTPATTSLRGPILNALEVFARSAQSRALKTIDRDALAIEAIILSWNLTEWTGDPCLPIPYSWIACDIVPTTSSPQITAVDLSGYGLEGTLPPSFANLVALTSLNLESNNLSGPLPDWLTSLTNLRTLSIQYNNFSGAIPAALLSPNNSLQFMYSPGNPFLTGGTLRSPPACCGKSNAAIIGVAVGGVILGLILIFVVFIAFRRYQRKRKPSSNDNPESNIRRMGTTGGAKAYTLAEVSAATMNFKTELGKGGFGPVYYGRLPDGQEVAVKVADGSSKQGEKEFFNEVDVLSRVHHRNLVALVGYCQEQGRMLLYEYMHNGSLFDHLHGKSVSTVGVLDWKMRLHIAHNAALGLEYLHTGCSPSFIHRDVKSSNILLTDKHDSKVADFGMTRLMGETEDTKVMTLVMGTAGYLDPEYYATNKVSSKSDVFSFGIVLLELLTGRLPITPSADTGKQSNLSNWVRQRLQNNDIHSILDPAVKASNPNIEAVWKVAEVAMRCVEPDGAHRPTMSEVVQELLGAETIEGTSASPSLQTHSPGYSDYSSGFQYAPTTYPAAR